MKRFFTFFAALICVMSMSAQTRIYCKMAQSWWKADGAAVGAHYWGTGTTSAWPGDRMTPVEGETDLWYIDLDLAKCQKIIFTRVNATGTVADWDAKTKDLTIPTDGKNLFTITTSSPIWGDPGCDGTWSTYNANGNTEDPTPTPTPDGEAKTIYLVPASWASDGAKFSVYSIATESFSAFLTSSDGIHYSASVANNTQIIFVRHDGTATTPTWENKWNQTDDLTIPAGKDCWKHTTWGADGGNCQGEWLVYPTSGETPTPTPDAGYYITGNAELVGADKAWTPDAISMTKKDENAFTHTFTDLAAGTVYRMKITNGTWNSNWGFSAVQNAPTGVVGDSDDNVVFELSVAGDVVVNFNGAKITLQGNFSSEAPIKPTHGSSVPSECEDVMLQAFYYDSYRDGAPGDVKINGTQLGNTKWDVLLEQSDEIGSYFDLVWLPPSSKSTGGTGYHPTQYSNQNSDWGSQNQLIEFINCMHTANSKVVADIVINHAGNKSGWGDFFPQNFGEYGIFKPDASWISSSDEMNFDPEAGDWRGKATGYEDGGYNGQDNYGSARDWAHAKTEVQDMMKAYLKWMKDVIGFDGWRYDYAQGFKGKYIDMYNSASANYFSVVEFWNNDVSGYLADAKWNTLAFDFGTKYSAIQGIADGDYTKCKGSGLLGAGHSKYAVTFVDSHDTYFGCQDGRDNQDEIGGCGKSMEDYNKGRVLSANAFILSMPGVPCVFYPHWKAYSAEINAMILARKAARVHSESKVSDECDGGGYRATVTGHNGTLVLELGNRVSDSKSGFAEMAAGSGYKIWVKTNSTPAPKLMVSQRSTIYRTATLNVEMKAIKYSHEGTAEIYYTLDGSDPKTSSTKQKYTSALPISGTTTLKAYAVYNGAASEVQSYTYTYNNEPITVKFQQPTVWKEVRLYAWDSKGELNGTWPGEKWTATDSEGWLYHTFEAANGDVNVIFSNGMGWQTSDITLSESACFEWDYENENAQRVYNCAFPFEVVFSPAGKVYKTETLQVELKTLGNKEVATIYYTLDGSNPKNSATKKTYTTPITIQGDVTISAYAVEGINETEVYTEVYTYELPQTTPIIVGFKKPDTWTKVHLYSWDKEDAHPTGDWPGTEMTNLQNGIYYYTFDAKYKEINFIFNDGKATGAVQSADLWTDEDVCYGWENNKAVLIECGEVSADVENVVVAPLLNLDLPMYNILGQQVDASYHGIVIQNGFKYIR